MSASPGHPVLLPPPPKAGASKFVIGLGVLALVVGLAMFRVFDPAHHGFFPKCAIHSLTGLDCPGCGGQRAVHHLLNGEISAAFRANALLLSLLIPMGVWLGLRWSLQRLSGRSLPALFLNRTALWLLLAALVLFGILRNLPGFVWLRP